MKLSKLNETGVAHWLLGVLVVAIVGAVGVYVFSASHADTPTTSNNYTGIGNLTTVWPPGYSNSGTATESLGACEWANNGGTGVTVEALANYVAQQDGGGVSIPASGINDGTDTGPLAENLELQSVKNGNVLASNEVSIVNSALGGAGGGNTTTRGADLASAQVNVSLKASNFRVYFYQHDKGGNGFKAATYKFFPSDAPGFSFVDGGVNADKLVKC